MLWSKPVSPIKTLLFSFLCKLTENSLQFKNIEKNEA
jgi:hypothetical protein